MKKDLSTLSSLLEQEMNQNNFQLILTLLKGEELLLPFNNNNLIELETNKNRRYIPLFTDKSQISNECHYTRLDKVKLDIVINDIFSLDKYYAISINPYTSDFIMNKKIIDIYKKCI